MMIKCPFLSQFTGPLPNLSKSRGEEPIVLFFLKAALLNFVTYVNTYTAPAIFSLNYSLKSFSNECRRKMLFQHRFTTRAACTDGLIKGLIALSPHSASFCE